MQDFSKEISQVLNLTEAHQIRPPVILFLYLKIRIIFPVHGESKEIT